MIEYSLPESLPKVALITGAGRRLGRVLALAFAQAGFDIAIHYRTSKRASDVLLQDLEKMGVSGCLLQANLANENEAEQLITRCTKQIGPLGVLVNNASVFERDEWDSVTCQTWEQHMQLNLRAPFVLMQNFAKVLPQGSEGLVINMLDERVWSLTPHFMSYTVSKSALWTLTQTMALALASRHIRVNAIGPGPALPSARQTTEQFNLQCQSVPLRRGTSPEEIAQAALSFLVLPSVTGQMLALDGGQHLQWAPTKEYVVEE